MPTDQPNLAIVLSEDGRETVLSAGQASAVLEQFDVVRREAMRWGRMAQTPGRLLLIDPVLITEVTEFLASR
jgi:hypothetical protein